MSNPTINPVTGKANDASLDPAGPTRTATTGAATTGAATPPPYRQGVSSDRIRNDIRETRGEMDETVDALADRLKPRHLLDDVLDYFTGRSGGETRETREKTGSADLRGAAGSAASSAASFTAEKGGDLARTVGSTLYKSVRRHPLPAALIGAGAAWMLFENDNDKVLEAHAKYRNYRDEPPMYSGSYVDARTGRPYDLDAYGREYRGEGARHEPTGQGSTGQATGARYGSAFAGSTSAGPIDYDAVTIDEADPNAPGYADRAREAARAAADRLKGSARDSAGKLRDAGGNLIDQAGNLADSAGNAISSAASSVGSAVSSAASGVADYASRGGQYAGEQSRAGYEASRRYGRQGLDAGKQYGRKGYAYSRDRFEDGLQEYPVGMGVAALAAGLLAGLLIPRTRYEDEAFGETSDHLKGQAAELGQHAYEEGKHVAQATYDAALEEAKKQGLTPDQMKAQAKRLADAAVAEAQERGLTADNLVDKAKHLAADASESVKHAASDAARTAKDAAKSTADRSGTDVAPSNLADKVKAVVAKASDTARHEAEEAKDHLAADAGGKADDAKQTVKSAASDAADAASKKV